MSIELKQAAQQAVDAFDTFGDADDFASLLELTRKMRALRAALPQAEPQQPATGEPDEWKLVPIVPTEKMLLAYTGGAVTNAGFSWCRHQWSAMLAAAPLPQQPKEPS